MGDSYAKTAPTAPPAEYPENQNFIQQQPLISQNGLNQQHLVYHNGLNQQHLVYHNGLNQQPMMQPAYQSPVPVFHAPPVASQQYAPAVPSQNYTAIQQPVQQYVFAPVAVPNYEFFHRPSASGLVCLLVVQLLFSVGVIFGKHSVESVYVIAGTAMGLAVFGSFAVVMRYGGVLWLHTQLTYSFAVFMSFFVIIYGIDYGQKCRQNLDLYARFSPVTRFTNCTGAVFVLIVYILCVLVEFLIGTLSVNFMKELVQSETRVVYKAGESKPELKKPTHALGVKMKIFTALLCFGVLAAGVSTTIAPYVRMKNASVNPYVVPGQCPVGEDFLTEPMQNELACCEFHDSATCCTRAGTCDDKSNYLPLFSATGMENCRKYLGLLSCAPCLPDSQLFTANVSAVDRMCDSFCRQIFDACYDEAISPFSWNHQKYCEISFGTSVVPDGENCFNSGVRSTMSVSVMLFGVIFCMLYLL